MITEDSVDYTLQLANDYTIYTGSSDEVKACGNDGYKSGLRIYGSQTSFINIPYKKSVEIDIMVDNAMEVCSDFTMVPFMFYATCELPRAEGANVYQYRVERNVSTGTNYLSYKNPITEPVGHSFFVDLSWNFDSSPMSKDNNELEKRITTMLDDTTESITGTLSKDIKNSDSSSSNDGDYLAYLPYVVVLLLILNLIGVMILLVRGRANEAQSSESKPQNGNSNELAQYSAVGPSTL